MTNLTTRISPAHALHGRIAAAWLGYTLILVAAAPAQTPPPVPETVVLNFDTAPKGDSPDTRLIRDGKGNLYGTAPSGGTGNVGVVYKVDTAGHETVLHSFAGGSDGADPTSGLTADLEGNLYGTTGLGGPANAGTIYKIDASGQETILYSFTGGADGGSPEAGVIRDQEGNLYGTTFTGGTADAGTVFKLDTTGRETVLHSFGGPNDGSNPQTGVSRDAEGNLYGTLTYSGGFLVAGLVYKVSANGDETILYSFTGGADGGEPEAGVILDGAGNLYGTTAEGGSTDNGVVYKLNTSGLETVLYDFPGGTGGSEPAANVVRDAAGTLYGTTSFGGSTNGGVVFKLDSSGHETVLCSLLSRGPNSSLILDAQGNLYGTSGSVGTGAGVVYQVDSNGQETNLYSFTIGAGGVEPQPGVLTDAAGNLYGTTFFGGAANVGVVYKVDTHGFERVLYTFTGGADGGNPAGSLVLDSAGNLYGTTYSGVYKLDPAGRLTVLYTFSGGADGSLPESGVIRDLAGNLYGTTYEGGPANAGVVFKIDASGQETVLYAFTGKGDGYQPSGGLTLDGAGNLYGATSLGGAFKHGVVFKLDSTGHETVLHSFTGGGDGESPSGGVILDPDGNLYGTTSYGGAYERGTVFEVDTTGHETILHSFGLVPDGVEPAGIVRDAAGNLYGTTSGGGPLTDHFGVAYQLDSTGQETILYSFTGLTDGAYPNGVITLSPEGNLFGTTQSGGLTGGGVLFKLELN